MDTNVGGYDRIARLVLGPILLLAGIAGYAGAFALAFGPVPQALGSILVFLIGIVLLVSGLVRKCPINRLLGIDTARHEQPDEADAAEHPQ